MNKWLLHIATLLFIAVFAVGCSADEAEQSQSDNQTQQTEENGDMEEQNEDIVRITISKDHQQEYINEKEIEIEKGAVLMDVLKENFYVKTAPDGQITSIERVAPKEDEEKVWTFTVNDEVPNVDATAYELSPGDQVSFDLHAQ
ncbi:DUF4430 domain-containing protein [Lentibacillus cibarius]|uniref:DUF4430 domain-containing protein n=1 Tax=Lentibacillus cibarius TaxID=2583219 RepID=A0A5S3QG59_9BACI|nr:DUF4430 domain-containing protein [Lentibacillus cibarius]TMN20709.1 DUF4430 domain-containing protein [Lentibacillus cibarius]